MTCSYRRASPTEYLRAHMVVTCIVDNYGQVQRIKRDLMGMTVYEDKAGENQVVVSVRGNTSSEVERVRKAFETAKAGQITEFEEAA